VQRARLRVEFDFHRSRRNDLAWLLTIRRRVCLSVHLTRDDVALLLGRVLNGLLVVRSSSTRRIREGALSKGGWLTRDDIGGGRPSHVRELVCEQVSPLARLRRELAARECDVAAERKRARADRVGGVGGGAVLVNAHVGEVSLEARL